jgi:integrase
MGYVTVAYPKRGLRFPKLSEKPPFQTWAEIEEQIARGESEELWDCLFLSVAEITDVLAYVRATARHPFIYPMFVFAAHTGVRRSEIVRSRRADFDFNSKTVLVREKKRTRGRHTFRRIPLSQQLVEVMQDWFSQHPGGPFTITQAANGESNGDGAGEQPTVDMATFHFRSTLRGSKWEKLPGWHVFRHSFASNCAARAIDQRMIDEWMGHQTEEMRRRYRHFFPDQKRRAIDSVFQSAADTQAV